MQSLVLISGSVLSSSSSNLLNNAFADDMMGGSMGGGDSNQGGDSGDGGDGNDDDSSNDMPKDAPLTTDALTAGGGSGNDDDDDDNSDGSGGNGDNDNDNNGDKDKDNEPTSNDEPVTTNTLTAKKIECPPGQDYYLFSTSCKPKPTDQSTPTDSVIFSPMTVQQGPTQLPPTTNVDVGDEPLPMPTITAKPDGLWQGIGWGLVDATPIGLILDVELPGPENLGGEGFLATQTIMSVLDAKSAIKSIVRNADDVVGAAIDASSSSVKGSGDDLVKGISRTGDDVGDVSKGTKSGDAIPPDGGSTPPTGPPSYTPPVRKGPIPNEPPHSLSEQIVLKDAMGGGGKEVIPSHLLGDSPRLVDNYGPGDWVKMETKHVTPDGKQINVHWFKNKSTGEGVEFKFKIREADKIGYSGESITGTFPRGGVGNPGPSVPIPPGAPAPLPP